MIVCSECGKEIDGNEENCPYCGAQIDPVDIYNQWSNQESTKELHRQGTGKDKNSLIKKILLFLGFIIVILIIVSIIIAVSKKPNDPDNGKNLGVIEDDYKPNIDNKKKPSKKEDKEPQMVEEPIKPKEEPPKPKEEPSKPKEESLESKYKKVEDPVILQALGNADKAFKTIVESTNHKNIIIKNTGDKEYIQLSNEFNTKAKINNHLKGKISKEKISEIWKSDTFFEKDGEVYVPYGNIGLAMDVGKCKIVKRDNKKDRIEVKILENDDFGGNEEKDGILIFEDNKLLVENWPFF